MSKKYIRFPVDKEHKKFCEFMGYPLLSEKNEFFIYEVPHNHICRFLINYEKWMQGSFDKDAFIKQNDI